MHKWLALAFLLSTGLFVQADATARRVPAVNPISFRTTTPGALSGLALPDQTLQKIDDRLTIDAYQTRHHVVAPSIRASPRLRFTAPPRVPGAIRVSRPALPPAVAAFRLTNQVHFLPPRGFRAPVLENAAESWLPRLPEPLPPAEREASRIVEQRLAADGLLPTLARLLMTLGPENCLTNLPATHRRLLALGFPADLLHHFRLTESAHPGARPLLLIEHYARRLLDTPNVEAVVAHPPPVTFDYQPSMPGFSWVHRLRAGAVTPEAHVSGNTIEFTGRFAVATESGDDEIGLLRMQVGGGWRDGVVPGGSLDVVSQMVNHFRSADFLISVVADASPPLQSIATNSWRLRRRGQVAICEEPIEPSAWAQDNGKAGILRGSNGLPSRAATLAPRYACMDEGKSAFLPAESYLLDGLRAAGHPVIHSPLLFQGGNLLAVRQPRTGRRVLFLSQGEIHRNLALGLSRAEVLKAFQIEFAVDECVIIPVLSYHLDFDVTFRNTGSELIAFVNDAPTAARRIVDLGLDALGRHGMLEPDALAAGKSHLTAGRDAPAIAGITGVLSRFRDGTNAFSAALSRAFVSDSTDDAAGNLQVFLLSLDLLESALPPAVIAPSPADRGAYLKALRRMDEARQRQITVLRNAGCRVVPIPSQHDLYRSINYLNGVQHRGGYIMPGFGGFYASLDQAALAAFRAALGPDLHITTIQTSECQRLSGSVHCTASVYPKL